MPRAYREEWAQLLGYVQMAKYQGASICYGKRLEFFDFTSSLSAHQQADWRGWTVLLLHRLFII